MCGNSYADLGKRPFLGCDDSGNYVRQGLPPVLADLDPTGHVRPKFGEFYRDPTRQQDYVRCADSYVILGDRSHRKPALSSAEDPPGVVQFDRTTESTTELTTDSTTESNGPGWAGGPGTRGGWGLPRGRARKGGQGRDLDSATPTGADNLRRQRGQGHSTV